MKVVDDCTHVQPGRLHEGRLDARRLAVHEEAVHASRQRPQGTTPTDPEAIRLEIRAEIDQWRPDEGGGTHTDYYLIAPDREEMMPIDVGEEARLPATRTRARRRTARSQCNVTGRQIIERYVFGDKELGYQGLARAGPQRSRSPTIASSASS